MEIQILLYNLVPNNIFIANIFSIILFAYILFVYITIKYRFIQLQLYFIVYLHENILYVFLTHKDLPLPEPNKSIEKEVRAHCFYITYPLPCISDYHRNPDCSPKYKDLTRKSYTTTQRSGRKKTSSFYTRESKTSRVYDRLILPHFKFYLSPILRDPHAGIVKIERRILGRQFHWSSCSIYSLLSRAAIASFSPTCFNRRFRN